MSTHGQFNTKSPTIKRILREAAELSSSPSADYHAAPLESNLLEWHFTLRGPPAPSPFANGLYHGRIVLPPTYPLRPPSFRFLTPSGRFEPNREICLSISGHHEESWQPAWGIRTALVAIRSFMDSEARGQLGGIEAGEETRRGLAGVSGEWRCGGCGGRSNGEIMREVEEEARRAEGEGEGREKVEEKVPEELRLAYRDELGKDKETAGDATGTAPSAASDSTAQHPSPPQPPPPATPALAPATLPPTLIPTPTTSTPIPTRTTTASQTQQQPLLQTQPDSSSWLDLAIIGIAVALGILVMRKFLTITG